MLGWADLVDEQITGPSRDRLLRGELVRYPDEAIAAFTTLTGVLPRMFSWLAARYVEQRVMGSRGPREAPRLAGSRADPADGGTPGDRVC
jgi:hypothetical protein